jgi:AcrR family transcriptional regulator
MQKTQATEEEQRKPRRRVAGSDPVKRTQILDGAKRCFLDLGFEASSMNDITSESGVSKGTLYVYFEDKSDLFKALIDREKGAVIQAAKEKLYAEETLPAALQAYGTYVTSRLTSQEVIKAQRMVLGVAERFPDIAARFFNTDTFSPHRVLTEFLDAKVAKGDLLIEDTDFAAMQFLELSMTSIYKRRLFNNRTQPADEVEIGQIVASAVAMFLNFYAPSSNDVGAREQKLRKVALR